MADEFDPYHKWLGIPPKDQPPNHYRLLGVELYESDAEVIDAAANRLLDYLQSASVGPHLAAAQTLMNEVAAARLCLLDERKKEDYDERLRAERAERKIAVRQPHKRELPPPPPPPPPTAVPTFVSPSPHGLTSAAPKAIRRKNSQLGLTLGLGALLLAVSGVAVYVLVINSRGDAPDSKALQTHTGAEKIGKGPSLAAGPRQDGASIPNPAEPPVEPGDSAPIGPKDDPGPNKKPREPRPDPAGLIKAADEAIKKKDLIKAKELLEAYVDHPDPADEDKTEALKLITAIDQVISDEFALLWLSRLSERQLRALEKDLYDPEMPSPFGEVFLETLKKNLPEFRRLQMKEKERAKEEKSAKDAQEKPEPKPQPKPMPVTNPEEFLAGKGLQKRGSLLLLDEEPLLAHLGSLPDPERKYQAASRKAAEAIKSLKRNKKLAEMAANNEGLRSLLKAKITAHNDLALLVLKLRGQFDEMQSKYRALADDPQVAEALGKLAGKEKSALGPSSNFTQAAGKLAKAEALVLTDEVPLYLQGPKTVVSAIVGDALALDFELRRPDESNLIPEAAVKKLGLEIGPTPRQLQLSWRGADGSEKKVVCPQIILPSLRVGRHVLKDREFFVTPPEAAELGACLIRSAFDGYEADADRDNFVFRLRPAGEPAEKESKSGKEAKSKR